MPGIVSSVLNDGGADLRRRLIAIYAVLIGGNVLVWLWALAALGDRPVLWARRCSPIRSVCATRSTPIISRRSTTSRAS